MNVKEIIKKLDSKLVRLGSSLFGIETSDYDYAVSESMWKKIYPILKTNLQFSDVNINSGYGPKYNHETCKFPMFNINNVKLQKDSIIFDFIIYKDSDMPLVSETVKKVLKLFHTSNEIGNLIKNNKMVRIEIFQYFLNEEFNPNGNSESEQLDSLFDNL